MQQLKREYSSTEHTPPHLAALLSLPLSPPVLHARSRVTAPPSQTGVNAERQLQFTAPGTRLTNWAKVAFQRAAEALPNMSEGLGLDARTGQYPAGFKRATPSTRHERLSPWRDRVGRGDLTTLMADGSAPHHLDRDG